MWSLGKRLNLAGFVDWALGGKQKNKPSHTKQKAKKIIKRRKANKQASRNRRNK